MGVVENLKDAADLLRKAGQIELYKQISAAEDEVRELAREKRRIEDRVEELERALRFKEETVFKAPFYYLKQGDQTPYCPTAGRSTGKRCMQSSGLKTTRPPIGSALHASNSTGLKRAAAGGSTKYCRAPVRGVEV
jgi:hypothetical protein